MNPSPSDRLHPTVTAVIDLTDIPWPQPQPAPRVLSGQPRTRTVALVDSGAHQAGVWECTPGEFASDHRGYVEFMHIIDGDADLVGDDGEVVTLGPGTVLTIPDGWTGRWLVRRTVVKSFAIFRG